MKESNRYASRPPPRREKRACFEASPRSANLCDHGSYRLAATRNVEQVALEMGNSPRKVPENYNNPQPEELARDYFNLLPPSRENVIPMNLELSFK